MPELDRKKPKRTGEGAGGADLSFKDVRSQIPDTKEVMKGIEDTLIDTEKKSKGCGCFDY